MLWGFGGIYNVRKRPFLIKIKIPSLKAGCLGKFLFLLSKNMNSRFLFSSQNWETTFKIFLSLLEHGETVFTFPFSSWSLRIEYPFLFLLSKVENIFLDFSFSSRNWGKEFPVSLSSLETGEKNFKFLFLFSIGLFGLSSMTAPWLGL